MPYQPYEQFRKKQEEKNPYVQFRKDFVRAENEQEKIDAKEKFPALGPEDRGYASDDPWAVNLGAGMKNFLTGAGQMILPKSLEFGPFTDEARSEDAKVRRSLRGTPGSTVATMIGETVPTLPLGSGMGAAVERAIPAAARAPTAVFKAVKALGSTPVQQGVEGAISGGATADPNHAEGAAGMSAGLSMLMGRIAAAGRRAGSGVVTKSQAAQDLEHLAGQHGEEIFLPLAQAADDNTLMNRIIKGGYREVLPLVPGTSGRLLKQAEDVKGVVRRIAANEAAPVGMNVPAKVEDDITSFRRALKSEFDKRYSDTVKQYAFNVPFDFRDQVVQRIKKAIPNVDDVTLNKIATEADQHMQRYSSGQGVIDGDNLLNVKNAIGRMWGSAKGPEKPAVEAAQGYIDEMVANDLKIGNKPQNLQDLKTYQDLDAPYRNYLVLRKAANAAKANRGAFTPSQLARASRDPSEMLDLAQTAQAATKDPVASRAPRWVGYGGVLGVGALSPVSALAMLGGGQLLSTKTVQRALLGDLSAQKTIMDFLDQNPTLMKELGRTFRNTTSTQVGEHYGP